MRMIKADVEKHIQDGNLTQGGTNLALVHGHFLKAYHDLDVMDQLDQLNEEPSTEWVSCPDWVVVSGYYGMYHSALALLALKGWKSRDHDATIGMLQYLYVYRGGKLTFADVMKLEKAKTLRDQVEKLARAKRMRKTASYGVDFSLKGCDLCQRRNSDMTYSGNEFYDWLSPVSLRIIGELSRGPSNVLQLSKRLRRMPYATVLRWVNRLEKAGVVVSTYAGKRRSVSLRPYHVSDAAVELHNRLRLREALHAAPKELVNAVLNLVDELGRLGTVEAYFYGSFVAKTARRGSDVDALIVVPDKSDAADKIQAFVQAVSETVVGEIHPVILEKSEFKKLMREKNPLVEGALTDGIRIRCFGGMAAEKK